MGSCGLFQMSSAWRATQVVDVSRFVCASSCTFATNSDVFHVDVFLIIKFGSMINEQGFPRGSYGKCKGRCLISVLTVGRGIVPVNFRMKWLW